MLKIVTLLLVLVYHANGTAIQHVPSITKVEKSRCDDCSEFDSSYEKRFTSAPRITKAAPMNEDNHNVTKTTTFTTTSPPTKENGPQLAPLFRPNTNNTLLSDNSTSSLPNYDGVKPTGLDVLVSIFFFLAAAWLVLAIFYSILAVIVLRLRAEGELDIYEEHFGRIYLCGSSRFYLPLGCILRRYVIALGYDSPSSYASNNGDDSGTRGLRLRGRGRDKFHFISRQERRRAVEVLLLGKSLTKTSHDVAATSQFIKDKKYRQHQYMTQSSTDMSVSINNDRPDSDCNETVLSRSIDHHEECLSTNDALSDSLAASDEAVCTICLERYDDASTNDEGYDNVFTSQVCGHRFHMKCIMEWLERRANTECPCCRKHIISDAQVWETVKTIRKQELQRKFLPRWLASSLTTSSQNQQNADSNVDVTVIDIPTSSINENGSIRELSPMSRDRDLELGL